MSALLEVDSVHKYFGGIKAVQGVSFKVKEKTIQGIIGPNGSGKTTLVNLITGFYKPDKGRIIFDGTDITGWTSHRIFRFAIARTFQIVRLFNNLTLDHNISIARLASTSNRLGDNDIEELLERLDLSLKRRAYVKNLSLFDQRKLEVALKLINRPKILILDEPTAGMNPTEISFFLDFVKELKKKMTIIIIEHSIYVITKVSENCIVLNEGVKIGEGCPDDVVREKAVIEAWIGRG